MMPWQYAMVSPKDKKVVSSMMNDLDAIEGATGPRVLIVGGVAGGASCAARVRRLSENAEIIVFERGPYVSFANCGLPYYVGDVITDEQELLVASPELFRDRFNIDVRTRSEVTAIDRNSCEVSVLDSESGQSYRERYDALVLAPGAAPIRPPLPGIDLPGIFTLRTIPDARRIREWIAARQVQRAIIVGGGFIGLEMVENLASHGVSVGIVDMATQILPALDPEMVTPIQDHLLAKGVSLHLGDAVAGFERASGGDTLVVSTAGGETHGCDMVILAIGVRPETGLARQADIEIGALGGIRVDERMQTSDERIWAVGDAVEVRDIVSGEWTLTALAGPANRQGRVAADAVLGRDTAFRGTQATAVCKVFDMVIASTGASEKALQRRGIGGQPAGYEKVYLHPAHHVGYYPGARTMTIKLIFSLEDGRIYGAQVVGEEGVARRVDAIAMAIRHGATVFDLEEAEMCYAPQFGSAKDPVNLAGMVAANVLRGDCPVVHWEEVEQSPAAVLDVRSVLEYDTEHVSGAIHIPLEELRARLRELPSDREVLAYCEAGQRSYYATRILRLNGYPARNISGGMALRKMRPKPATD